MLSSYVPRIIPILERAGAQGLAGPFARVYQSTRIKADREINRVWGKIVGNGETALVEEDVGLPLNVLAFPEYQKGSLWTVDEELRGLGSRPVILVVLYLKALSEQAIELVSMLDREIGDCFDGCVRYVGDDFERILTEKTENEWKLPILRVQERDRGKLLEQEFPLVVVMYAGQVIWEGTSTDFYLQKMKEFYTSFNIYEGVSLITNECPRALEVVNLTDKTVKLIDISRGKVFLEFWDETTADLASENKKLLNANPLLNELAFIDIYMGSQTINYSQVLTSKAKAPVISLLRIIDFPTYFIIEDGAIIWRGNRLFENVSTILSQFVNYKEIVPRKSTGFSPENFRRLKELYSRSIAKHRDHQTPLDIELQLSFKLDFTSQRTYPEEYNIELISYSLTQEDFSVSHSIYESLATEFPQIKFELIKLDLQSSSSVLQLEATIQIREQAVHCPPDSSIDFTISYSQLEELQNKCEILSEDLRLREE